MPTAVPFLLSVPWLAHRERSIDGVFGHADLMATLPWRSIVTSDGWKLNLCAGDQSVLFDLNADPCEQTNHFHDPAHRDRIRGPHPPVGTRTPATTLHSPPSER